MSRLSKDYSPKNDRRQSLLSSYDELKKDDIDFEIPCPKHPSRFLKKLCKYCFKTNDFLLCDQCLIENIKIHQSHPKYVINLDDYLDKCMAAFPEKIKIEEDDAKNILDQLDVFIEETEEGEKKLKEIIEMEINLINTDFDIILKKMKDIEITIMNIKATFRKKLEDELSEIGNLRVELESFYNKGSPLYKKKSCISLEHILNNLKTINNKKNDFNFIQNTFSTLIKEFKYIEQDFELNFQKDFIIDNNQNEDAAWMLSKGEVTKTISNLVNEIRFKVKYPPKYKVYQNSNEDLNHFISGLDSMVKQIDDLGKKLLISQNEVFYQFLGNNSHENIIFGNNNSTLLRIKEHNSHSVFSDFEIATSIATNHKKGINCLCIYDDNHFVSCANDYIIKVWNLYTFKCVKNLKCESIPYVLHSMTNSNSEKILISGHSQGYIAIFNSDFDLACVIKQQESIISSIISLHDKKTIVCGSYDSSIIVVDTISGQVLKKIVNHEESVNCLSYSPNLNKFASGSDDGNIIIWEIKLTVNFLSNLKEESKMPNIGCDEIKGTYDSIESSDQIDEENLPLNAEEEKKIECESSSSDSSFQGVKNDCTLHTGNEVKSIVFLKKNPRILLSTCHNIIKIWDIETKTCVMKIGKQDACINKILGIEERLFHSLGKKRTESLNIIKNLPLNKKDMNLLQLMSIDHLHILTFSQDHQIQLWNASDGVCLHKSNDNIKELSALNTLESALLVHNVKDNLIYFICTGDRDNIINIWKIKEQKEKELV